MSTSPTTVPSLDTTHPIERARPNAWRRRGLRNRRGAVVVEFALIATLLVSMIVGVVDFGRAVWVRVSVGHAAREGARWAIVRGSESGRVADTAAVGAYVRSKIPISPLAV